MKRTLTLVVATAVLTLPAQILPLPATGPRPVPPGLKGRRSGPKRASVIPPPPAEHRFPIDLSLPAGLLPVATALPSPAIPDPAPMPAVPATPPPPAVPAPPPKRFNIRVFNEGPSTFLPRLAKLAGVKLTCLGDMFVAINKTFHDATFEDVLGGICDPEGIQYRKQADGSYQVGYPSDLAVLVNNPQDSTPVEYLFRPRHLDPESLAQTLTAAFPDLKIAPGPVYLSPLLDTGGPAGGVLGTNPFMPGGPAITGNPGGMPAPTGNMTGPGAINPLNTSTTPFKRHAVTLLGPANRVRHAIILARRMDRGRRQVKINVNMTEMTNSDATNLGVNWDFSASGVTLGELPNTALTGTASALPTTTTTPATIANPGLRFGTFAHTPASVNLQLQANVQKGTSKTLANPSLLVIDGERCFLLLGDKYLYPKQVGLSAQGNPLYDVAQLATGIYLQMSVQIGLDDDVIITVYPQDSYVSGSQTYGNASYPVIVTREAQTTVRLRSGEMLAIGGLHQGSDSRNSSQVPLLGSIPLIGSLFGTRSRSKSRDELVILIQPELIPAEIDQVAEITEVK